ncbi:MAG: HD domain-containing protein [Candidatus Diapherotrites archaeon]|nr:HD domain-containing protein [Candidatus Diapherotrites archaeon]
MQNIGKKLSEKFTQETAEKIQAAAELAKETVSENTAKTILEELLELKTDSETICAAFLLQLLKNGKINAEDAAKKFGKSTTELAELVKKIQELPKKSTSDQKTEVLRKIMLSMSKDLRIIIISFADKIIELEEKPSKEAAKEASEIYSPLAHKLGMNRIKNIIENKSFEIQHPKEFKALEASIEESRESREKQVEIVKQILRDKLKSAGIEAEIYGRTKHLHSIWKKMQNKHKKLEEIYDLLAIRIITESVKECYQILGIVHEQWHPLSSEFNDYIAKPKPNLYQSLHTVIIGPNQKPIEIQIRTKEMHYIAETGIAAHWKYKKEQSDGEKLDKKLSWIKEAMEWMQDSEKAKEFLDSLKLDFFENEIFVFTPKGQAIELPEGATPIDFAFAVHSDLGFKIDKAIINGKAVPLDYKLQNGETVEIATSEKQQPKRQWLSFVKTSKASNKIRQALQIQAVTKKPAKIKQMAIKSISIKSAEDKTLKLSKCCKPVPGDEIMGFLTTKRKISVHRIDCPNAKASQGQRKIDVSWDIKGKGSFSVALKINAVEKPGLLSELLNVFAKFQARVSSANAKTTLNKMAECNFEIEIKNLKELEQIMEKVQAIKGVQTVSRS